MIKKFYRSNCDEEIGSLLRQHYQRPYFLPVTAETEKTDWIFMGSHGYGAPMHVGGNARACVSSFITGGAPMYHFSFLAGRRRGTPVVAGADQGREIVDPRPSQGVSLRLQEIGGDRASR